MELKFKKSAMLTWVWVLVLEDGREIPIKDMVTSLCLPALLFLGAIAVYELSRFDTIKELEFNAYVTGQSIEVSKGYGNADCKLTLVNNEAQVICQNQTKVLNTSVGSPFHGFN